MKKLALTIAIVLGLSMTTFADPNGGGLFQRGTTPDNGVYGNRATSDTPMLPNHGKTDNQDANAPLGTGIAVLAALGGAYLVAKKRREE
jgi:hypothetical protein